MTLSPEAREEAERLANDLRQYSNKTVGSLRIGVDEIALIVQALDAFSAPTASGGLEAVREAVAAVEQRADKMQPVIVLGDDESADLTPYQAGYQAGLRCAMKDIRAALAAPVTPAAGERDEAP